MKKLFISFITKFTSPENKMSFYLARVGILGLMECEKTRNDYFHDNQYKNNLKLKKDYAEKFTETTGIEI